MDKGKTVTEKGKNGNRKRRDRHKWDLRLWRCICESYPFFIFILLMTFSLVNSSLSFSSSALVIV